jgi:AsmA protein
LSGDVQLAVDDLVLNTVNLERSVCEAAALLAKQSPPNKQWPDQTALHEVVGAVQIKNGQAYIDPLGAKLDVLTVLGKGPVNLVDNTMDLELDLKLASDNPSAVFCEGMNPALYEIAWPLRCEGNYEMQDGKRLCNIDKSRLEQLALQAARQRLESELLRRLR